LVRPEEQVVEVQVDRVQVGFPFRVVEAEVDRRRMVLGVPSGAVLQVVLDLV